MKKSITIIVMAISISGMLMACSGPAKETSIVTKASEELVTIDSTHSGSTDKKELLPFGFTPKDFQNNFSDIAILSDISTDALQEITDTTSLFIAHSGAGSKATITLLSNSDGKTISIGVKSDSVNDNSFPDFAKAVLSAADMSLDYNELDAALDFNSIPRTIDDFKFCNSHGIELSFSSNGLHLIRDYDTQDEYSYTKNNSASKGAAATDTTSGSQNNISEVTQGQKNALSKARDYLNYSSFSYSGLIKQLEYEGFSTEEASYASDNCGADWKEQASKKALDYLSYSAFSYNGLIKQLEYEGFSSDEASFAADSCGVNWNEQAAKKAQDYLNYSSFSSSSLIKQLEYEGFTKEQAEYGVSAVGY